MEQLRPGVKDWAMETVEKQPLPRRGQGHTVQELPTAQLDG